MRHVHYASIAAFIATMALTRGAAADAPWASESALPEAMAEGPSSAAALARACGKPEAKLARVAAALVERKKSGAIYLEGDGLSELLRRAGEAHVWPRAWIASGRDLDDAQASPRLEKFGAALPTEGERRCGAARITLEDGSQIAAAVALDAVADLDAPLPTRGRTGQWIELKATVNIAATGARVVITGPHGAPKPVQTAWDGKHARARFVLSEPGAFTVQLMADGKRGPRPVLEARLFADVSPESDLNSATVPGEDAGKDFKGTDRAALYAMVDALRTSEVLKKLKRDPRLEKLAEEHAARMEQARAVGHDVGDGDPFERAEEAGLGADAVGENVANAESLVAAHRTLYRSPSHRGNLVRAEYTHMGFAVRKGKTGYWVTEVFATIR